MTVRNNNIFLLLIVPAIVIAPNASAESLPDPTRPSNYSEVTDIKAQLPKEFISWNVAAIRSSATGRNAIVNGRLVKVGDEIDTATIVDITSNSVVLAHDSKRLVLKLIPAEIKKIHSDTSIQNGN